MDSRDSPIYWSISCGNWFMTHVRVSIAVLAVVVSMCLRLPHWQLGLVFGAVFFVMLLIHEFSHILAVRWTGGVGNEILIWPLGGLAFVQPAGNFRSQFLTPAAGPLANLILCGLVAYPVFHHGAFPHVLNPFDFPAGLELSATSWASDVFVLVFWCNWILLLANLLPVFPLDGIRMALAVLKNRTDIESAAEIALQISFWVAAIIMLGGLFWDRSLIVFLGAVLFLMTFYEWIQMRTSEALDDSFMGYDFSQGYTSLERSSKQHQPAAKRRQSFLQSWRERRKVAKERRARFLDEQAQQQLDAILEKVHLYGIGSLSDGERRTLNRASARLRDRGKQAE